MIPELKKIRFKREKGKNNLAFVDIWVGENGFIKLVVEMTENNFLWILFKKKFGGNL